jgi:class 3 adenylate cyclase/sugar lactone lactonase YvrE
MVDNDGLIWICYRKWLYHYNPKTRKISEYKIPSDLIDTNKLDIHYIYQGNLDDAIWICTLESGLYKIDKQKKEIVGHYGAFDGSQPRFRHNKINGIYESADSILWVATGNGLHKWNPNSGKLKIYDKKQGMPNNFVNGLLSEGDSCIWISTDNGLSRFDVKSEKFNNFYKQDGISANEFNRVSFYRAKNGRMFFGGMNGINAFHPSDKFSHERKYKDNKILFTEFSKLDGDYDSIITKKIGLSSANTIELSHNDKFFSFQFALANYQNPSANTFSYMLEGYDKDWSKPSPVNSAKYNGIPPGTYTFKVRASSGKGLWNNEEMSITIIVKEAFYKTWWFIGLCFLFVLASVFGILEYQLYRSRQQKNELQRQVKARTSELERAMKKSDELLLNILPAETAEELKKFGKAKAKRHQPVTVLFTDFKGFTQFAEQLEPEELVAEIDYCFRNFDAIIEKYNIEKIKTIGDAYMCVGGIPNSENEDPQKVVLAALEIRDFMTNLAEKRARSGKECFGIRIGVHTGGVIAGIVGTKKFQYDVWGDTVNVAARMEDNSESGKVNISGTTYSLVRDYFECEHRGKVTAKNKGEIDMYFVERPFSS